jgi:acetylornithine/succinyldiaminopimelate/putrescine aminotransferase
MSERFRSHLEPLAKELPIIGELRILGMMIGIDLTLPATPAVAKSMERGLLINATHDTVVRLLPPINITPEEVDAGCEILADVLRGMDDEE